MFWQEKILRMAVNYVFRSCWKFAYYGLLELILYDIGRVA